MRSLAAVLLCAVLTLAAAVGAQAPAAAPARVLSMATLAPTGSTWMRVFDAANRELRRRTSGALSMRWYPGGVQGDEAEVVRKIRSGRLDGGAVTAVGLGQIHRPILAFQIPGIFVDEQHLVQARDALRSDLQAAFEAQGFMLLGFGSAGAPRMLSTREIRVPSDLRTAHPWQWREDLILPAIYAETGATGVTLQVPEVLSAIQTNRVDTVFASPLAAVALQWAAQMHYMSDRTTSASLGGIILSRSVFQSLPADQQSIVREVIHDFDLLLERNVGHDDEQAATSLQQRGVQVVTLNDAERAQWQQLFQRVRTRLVGTIADAAWINRVEAAGR